MCDSSYFDNSKVRSNFPIIEYNTGHDLVQQMLSSKIISFFHFYYANLIFVELNHSPEICSIIVMFDFSDNKTT
jgi:hypothetical protein